MTAVVTHHPTLNYILYYNCKIYIIILEGKKSINYKLQTADRARKEEANSKTHFIVMTSIWGRGKK